jgi:hypothetical protein
VAQPEKTQVMIIIKALDNSKKRIPNKKIIFFSIFLIRQKFVTSFDKAHHNTASPNARFDINLSIQVIILVY